MTATASAAAPAVPDDPLGLVARVLPRWAPLAVLAAAAGMTALLAAATPVQGVAGTALTLIASFVIGQTTASFAVEGRRHAVDRLFTTLIYASFGIAVIPLLSVMATVLSRGSGVINGTFLSHSLRNIGPGDTGGGIYHGILGTLEQGAVTSLISIPVAVLVAIYLVEYGRGRLARAVTFFVDVMTGIPSIVAGLFVFTVWILALGRQRAGFPAALALSVLMIPTVVRSTEEMLKLVPNELREAAFALGIPRWRTILKVVIPTALPGIVTGIMLGVARVIGETAPLLLLIGATSSINADLFHGPQAALPTIIFDQASRPNDEAIARAWGAALTLIALVMLLNLAARVIARLTRVR
jgi:phosphate transport system permease protein